MVIALDFISLHRGYACLMGGLEGSVKDLQLCTCGKPKVGNSYRRRLEHHSKTEL